MPETQADDINNYLECFSSSKPHSYFKPIVAMCIVEKNEHSTTYIEFNGWYLFLIPFVIFGFFISIALYLTLTLDNINLWKIVFLTVLYGVVFICAMYFKKTIKIARQSYKNAKQFIQITNKLNNLDP